MTVCLPSVNKLRPHPLVLDIWEGVRSRPGRFGLSLFAMSIGMAVLTTLIALLGGLESRSQQLSSQLGTNVIAILPKASSEKKILLTTHAHLLRENYPDAEVSALRRTTAHTSGTDRSLAVVAVEESFFAIRQWPIIAGRFFDQSDLHSRKRYAVVTQALLQDWHWKVGDTILLKNTPFLVIGVVGSDDSALGGEYGDSRLITGEIAVFVPLSVASHWDDQVDAGEPIDALYVRPPKDVPAAQVLPGLQNLLAQPDLKLQALSWIIPASLIKNLKQMQNTVGLTVGAIAVLCLVLGGTTLTSLLVANVRERIAEIGLRRAMGATELDIAVLFMAEGCAATVTAGILGSALIHLLIAQKLAILSRFPFELGIHTLLLPIVFSLILGALFSFWPAISAARISPAEALRAE
ncbi:MAG: ABC transporter permease [Amphritea sp.]|nr:ABC transporter permease [Amphritea sp.]